jgi:hypothetical protein
VVTQCSALRTSSMNMHADKLHHVITIARIAEHLGEDEDWLRNVASDMEIEDGVIVSMAPETTVSRHSLTSESKT